MQCTSIQHIAGHYSIVQYNMVQYGTIQYIATQFSTSYDNGLE